MAKIFTTNAGSLALQKKALADRTGERFRGAARMQAAQMLFAAQSYSSGRLSQSQLRRMGHPYAVRFLPGEAGQDDAVINRQTGLFARSWRTRVQQTPHGWTITLYNTAPEAKYLLGTRLMRVRPILEAVLRKTGYDMSPETRNVIRKAIKENAAASSVTGGVLGSIAYAVAVGVTSAVDAVEVDF